MKHATNLLAAILLCYAVSGQSGKISLSGTLHDQQKVSFIHVRNFQGVDIPVSVQSNKTLSLVADTLQKGFYAIDRVGMVYLCPGFQLNIKPASDNGYVFTGTGAVENNALLAARKQLFRFIPVNKNGELLQAAYMIDVPDFLQKLDSFQHNGEQLFKASKDTFFSKYATLDLQFYAKDLLADYNTNYGIDLEKQKKVNKTLHTIDRKSPNFGFNMLAAMNTARRKVMDLASRQKILRMLYQDWNRNDETLFKHSYWYRKALNGLLSFRSSGLKYLPDLRKGFRPEQQYINRLSAARDEFSNPYIISYFEYMLTGSILQATKDTAVLHQYYQEFVAKSIRPDYLSKISEVYTIATSYTDNMPAPQFSYPDINGRTVALESLRGKYVYIDVWATWCAPCKAEIPHLKKIQQAYRNKNIAFVSISVDEQKDLAKWKAYVRNNALNGIQLIADHGFESDFIHKMSINAIPRFILIDPSGKIISANALRPSESELRSILDKL